ncbi:MAG: N-formylglutamate amidohydrolase [Aestuariivirgaceae bacterium]
MADAFSPFDVLPGDPAQGVILICDHARNVLPGGYSSLGLPASELERHIAFDIGVDAVTRQLAERLNIPAVLSKFSRLLIDPNRGLDDPTLIMQVADGVVVAGNAEIDADERQHRIDSYYRPYHSAVSGLIDQGLKTGVVPALLSIHSFTPMWKGTPRPWHAGLLWDERDRRFCEALVAGLRQDPHLKVGDNEPYRGGLCGDTVDVHGTGRGLASALLEIRQDLIDDEAGVAEWVDRLAGLLPGIIALPQLHEQLAT